MIYNYKNSLFPNNILYEPTVFNRSNTRICGNISFLSNASKFGILLSTNILLALLRGGTCRI